MATIYELTEELQALLDMMADPETDPEVLADTIEAVQGEFADKADGYGRVRAELLGKAAALKAEEQRLAAYRKSIEGNIDKLEGALKAAMEQTGQKKIQTELFTFSIRNNPGKVVVLDERAVPFEFWKPADPTLDKTAIKDYLKEHADCTWAKIEAGTSLTIK
ncbi:MAG: siphovirus Gp157 family protein [Lachnospiraceae bacterium]|nr:siphovirus Gp157 family protein [Lachnospiraceae bacterium]